MHQLAYSPQLRDSGNPACKKQEASWTEQAETALKQEPWSVQVGRGLEHHLPHWYSQVGVGETVTVEVQREAVVFVVVVQVVEGLELDVVEEVEEVELVVLVAVEVVLELVDVMEVEEERVVVVVVEVEVLELEVDVVLVDGGTELEEGGPPPLHGWLDSKSAATYKLRADGPPQVSAVLPVQGILQVLLSIGTVPLPKTTPQ